MFSSGIDKYVSMELLSTVKYLIGANVNYFLIRSVWASG